MWGGQTVEGKSRGREANVGAVVRIQSTDVSGLDLAGHSAVGEKWSYTGCILKLKMTDTLLDETKCVSE